MSITPMTRKPKILVVFGTRPEAIKMLPVVAALTDDERFEFRICVTGQHRQMLDQILKPMGLEADYDLDVMASGQDLTDITVRVLQGMRSVLNNDKPDLVLVHGDTTTAASAALASFYEQVPVGHVEAGLRTRDLHSPFPEEFNRQLVGRIAAIHFAPTEISFENLVKEGIEPSSIFVTGNTVVDSVVSMLESIEQNQETAKQLDNSINSQISFDPSNQEFVLITAHRRESFGAGFERIVSAIKRLALSHPGTKFIYPVHLNPKVREPVANTLKGISNVHLIEPLPQLEFAFLLSRCLFVLTDSGGIQEEAPFLGKPVVLLRDTTERPEAVLNEAAVLVGTDEELIVSVCADLLRKSERFARMAQKRNIFGDGDASSKIVEAIDKYFESQS